MSTIGPDQWQPVDSLLDRLLLGADDALSAALADSATDGLPPSDVSPQSAPWLYLLNPNAEPATRRLGAPSAHCSDLDRHPVEYGIAR